MLRPRFAVALAVAAMLVGAAVSARQTASKGAPAPVIVLETSKGTIEIETLPNESPKSLDHVLSLAKKGFYRGQRFHWVQPGVVQFGDPTSRDLSRQDAWGKGGSGQPVGVAEMSKRSFDRGTVGLAYRSDQRPVAADSQLFILRGPNPALNGKYAILGRVVSKPSLAVLDKIEQGDMIKMVTVK